MRCSVCRDRGVIQVAFGKSNEMQMVERRCPQCNVTDEEKRMAKSEGESKAPKVSKQGKLSTGMRKRIGTVGSSKREEMPSHVFLQGKERKYPVKLNQGGKWVYSPRLLLAAARRARMQGAAAIASRADSIRSRLGKSETLYPYVDGIVEEVLLKSKMGSAWRWLCSCGMSGHGPTEEEAVTNWTIHREEAGIPTGMEFKNVQTMGGPGIGHHKLVNVEDTRTGAHGIGVPLAQSQRGILEYIHSRA